MGLAKITDRQVRVLVVFGTRPEAIKMAPLVHALKQSPDFDTYVCVTAQHRQMLDQVLRIFSITPDDDLNIMQEKQTLSGITIKVLQGLEKVIANRKPDIILVHGDTTTTFAAALAAFYQQVAIGHVEAGLRTWDKYSPYPEEMNRQLTGVMTDLHFAPTARAARHLLQESKPPERIHVTGNTVVDALRTTVRSDYTHPVLEQFKDKRMIFMTAHRRENLGNPMRSIFAGIRRLVDRHADVALIYPVHLNPEVRKVANEVLGGHPRIALIDPLNAIDAHNFIARATLILTDSGGIQEEAPSFGVPVLVLRNTTERPEGLEAGTLKLAGTDGRVVEEMAEELLTDKTAYLRMSQAANPYGDGMASQRIVEAMRFHFGRSAEVPKPYSGS
jgi:UDP-N-acetylglucosamine 2-epimerase (non-hydrolysing)